MTWLLALGLHAQTGFYDFDNVVATSILDLFKTALDNGKKYPSDEDFAKIGVTRADLEFIRSHVKRAEHVNPTDRLNKDAYEYRKLFMCFPMGNGTGGVNGYPSNAKAKTDAFTMWNYATEFGSWNHGFFTAPGSWVDAAHKNGSRIMSGMFMFDGAFNGEEDDKEWADFISKTDASGKYIYAEPMINALMFFGHDGLTYNWEAFKFKEAGVIGFHRALYKLAKERNFTDYNSIIYYHGYLSLNSGNREYVYGTKDEPIHQMFLNYSGRNFTNDMASSYSYAENQCGGAERLFAGTHIAELSNNWQRLKSPGAEKINVILWGEHTCNQIYNHVKGANDDEWQKNYQMYQERFISGSNQNPATRPDYMEARNTTYSSDIANFCGMAEFIPEHSTLAKPFLTHFNIGNGDFYYYHGVKRTDGGWYNMASQDLVPTYRWLVYNAGSEVVNSALKAEFTHTDAYVGGSSLKLKGDVTSTGADVVLYKSQVQLGTNPFAKVAVKKITGDATVALIVRVNGAWQEYAVDATSTSWKEVQVKLDNLNGGTIERIGLRVKGNADVLVGKIELNDDTHVAPKAIKEFVSAEKVSESTTDITLKLYWTVDAEVDEYGRSFNDVNNIDHFEIFLKKGNEAIEIGRTSQWATLAAHVPFPADDATIEVGVRSVSTDLKTASEIKWLTVNKGTPDEVIDKDDTSKNGEFYKVRYNKRTPHSREDRYMMHVGFKDASNKLQQYPDNNSSARITKQFYLDVTDKAVFDVEAGKTYTPYIAYHGLWMSGYVYADWNNDGEFNFTDGITFNNNIPTRTDRCEILSFSAHNASKSDYGSWYNSEGSKFNTSSQFPKDDNVKNWLGKFTVPADLQPGVYRVRFKLDWNELDPAGDKDILQNGGDIIDALINVHTSTVKVGAQGEGCTISKESVVLTSSFNATAPYKQAFDVTAAITGSEKLVSLIVRHGYNLDKDAEYDAVGNRQWWSDRIEVGTSSTVTIPAEFVNGNVLIMPEFETSTGIDKIALTKEVIEASNVYNLNGQLVKRAGSNRTLPAGVYVIKGSKFVVK